MRIIARLDVKGPNLIKSINLEGLRVMGNPNDFAKKYYKEGADELIFMDLVASLYNRNSLHDIIKLACEDIFIPFTVGGGIRSLDDALKIFDSGADKISIHTNAVQNPNILSILSKRFGSQAIVLSVEAKKNQKEKWDDYVESGREKTDLDVVEWVKKAQDLGIGEILLTSVDKEGTTEGFDIDLITAVTDVVDVPVIASGGFGKLNDVEQAVKIGGADAIALAHVLHYEKISLRDIRNKAIDLNLGVRKFNQ